MPDLSTMLTYRRPTGSRHERKFNRRYIEPVFGRSDKHGNYTHIVGDKPNLAFMAHTDTVHRESGRQTIQITDGFLHLPKGSKSNCLGADCTTGVWLILEMIEAQVPGVYVLHAAEEVGCRGSSALVADNPTWLKHVDAAISLDRKGTESVITHQMGGRTSSDAFAKSIARALDLEMKPDPNGSYTDSNEYADVISECTNISVGYYSQHTHMEQQDVGFAYDLRDALITADFTNLEFERKPGEIDYTSHYEDRFWGYPRMIGKHQTDDDPLIKLISDYPEDVAHLLRSLNYSYMDVCDYMGIYPDLEGVF